MRGKERRSVLIVNYDKRWGGGQEYLQILIKNLLAKHYSVGQLITPNSMSEERFIGLFGNDIDYRAFVKKPSSCFDIPLIISIIEFARNYEIIHIHREHDIWLGIAIKFFNRKTRLVFSQHIKPIKKRYLLNLYDEIICNSVYVQSLFNELYKRKSHLIFPSISSISSITQNQSDVPIKLKGNPILLMSGAFYKNQEEMIVILEKVLKVLPDAQLYFIAPSQTTLAIENIKNIIEQKKLEKKIHILEPVQRGVYLKLLDQIDIFVSTYKEEAFGLAVLEAALLEKYIILYGNGGSLEILNKYSKASIIPQDERELFASTIINVFQSGEYLKSINIEAISEQFSEKRLIEDHINVYS